MLKDDKAQNANIRYQPGKLSGTICLWHYSSILSEKAQGHPILTMPLSVTQATNTQSKNTEGYNILEYRTNA